MIEIHFRRIMCLGVVGTEPKSLEKNKKKNKQELEKRKRSDTVQITALL